MVETIVRNHLKSALDVPVLLEVPEKMPETFILIEKTGASRENYIDRATIAVQSWAASMYEAASLNDKVKKAMDSLPELPNVSRAALNSDYNHTDTSTKKYRYQAVYDLTYYEEDNNV